MNTYVIVLGIEVRVQCQLPSEPLKSIFIYAPCIFIFFVHMYFI